MEYDVWFRMPDDSNRLIHLFEGCGCNLFQEDIDDGYVDYFMYDEYVWNEDTQSFEEYDGGQILTTRLICDMTEAEKLGCFEKFWYVGDYKELLTPETIIREEEPAWY